MVNIKAVAQEKSAQQRFRIAVSDGVDIVQGMLNTQLNQLVLDHIIQDKSLLQLTDYVMNDINGQK